MNPDPKLQETLLGMDNKELLEFFEEVVVETSTTLGMNDYKKCSANTKAEAKLSQVREYMLLRMTH